jgi:hypothetical protein
METSMNVYILLGYTLPELTEIISVHLTKELAKEALRKYKNSHRGYNGYDDYSIETWEVEGNETGIPNFTLADAVEYVRTGKTTPQIEEFLRNVPSITPKSAAAKPGDREDEPEAHWR